jgi:SAM-dependent methyltransferase
VELHQGDVTRLRNADNALQSVNIANAFHCFADPEAALREIHRVLAPGGTLAMNVLLHPRGGWPLRRIAERINAWGIRKGILVTPYRRVDLLDKVRAAGFEVQEESVYGNACSLVAVKKGP